VIRTALLALILAPILATPVAAQTDPTLLAQRARSQLDLAAAALEQADGARDRVAALTKTVQAYESGLTAMRAGLRAAAQRERSLSTAFDAKRDEISQLLGVLAGMGRDPAPVSLLHPSGPLGTARSGMILAEVTPALQAEANRLRAQLEEILLLRALQESAQDTLTRALSGAQEARVALATAIGDRTDLPTRFTADPDRMRELLQTADTLDAFAAGLGALADAAPAPMSLDTVIGDLALPVQGVLLRRFNEADAAGIRRPGVLIATGPAALVTSPLPATLRFVGPLLDYGNVMILEPARDVLMVLGGLSEVYVSTGDVITGGTPLGLMGNGTESTGATPSTNQSETLYIEVRHNEETADPEEWFAMERN